MAERPISAVEPYPWWPGRTDEVQRVADRLRKLGQPDGKTTNGELAATTSSGVAIVLDAIDMNDALDDMMSQCLGAP